MFGPDIWRDQDGNTRAECALLDQVDAERMFFSGDVGDLTEGKRLCQDCPVLAECRAWGDEHEITKRGYLAGVLGGEFPTERLNRRRDQAAAS